MRNYNTTRNSTKTDFGGKDDFGRPKMYNAICSKCGKECQVPFKPRGDKPIYCSECFERKSGGSSHRSDRRDSGSRRFKEKRLYHAVCDECGNDCEVPFKPTSGKPVFCDNCFKGTGRRSKGREKGHDDKKLQEQINVINGKLDMIIQTLESLTVVKEKTKRKSSVKKPVSKKKKAKKATSKKEKVKAKKSTKKKARKTTKKKSITKKKKAKTKTLTSKKR